MSECVLGSHVASTVLLVYPDFLERAFSVGGQLRGDKECQCIQWSNRFWQSLEEGAGIQYLECALHPPPPHPPRYLYGVAPSFTLPTLSTLLPSVTAFP